MEAAVVFSSIEIKVERENGVSFSSKGLYAPHGGGQAEIGHQIKKWLEQWPHDDCDFNFFWCGINVFLPIDDSVIIPDVTAGPTTNDFRMTTLHVKSAIETP